MKFILSTLVRVWLCCFLLSALVGASAWGQTFAVLQGATNEESAQFVVLVPKNSDSSVKITSESGTQLIPTWIVEVLDPDAKSDWKVLKFKVDGLSLGERYKLRVRTSSGLKDERTFKALDSDLRYPKVAVTSCMVDWLHNAGAWEQMREQNPDLIVFVGDTTYVDIGSPEELIFRPKMDEVIHWKRFTETRNTLDVFRWKELKPILALPDDHDFGFDNVNSSYPLKLQANLAFDTFFGQSGEDFIFERGPGNSFKADLFGFSFVFLDGRNFRVNGSVMFADEQLNWIKALDLQAQSFAVTGSQFFGKYLRKDSFEGNFPENFRDFLSTLRSMNSKFSFLSGDVHFSEVMKIGPDALGYETFEITSSSIHSFTIAGGHAFRPKNPRRIPGLVTSTHNFQTMEWDTLKMKQINVRAHGWRGQNLFEGLLDIPGSSSPHSVKGFGPTSGCTHFLRPG